MTRDHAPGELVIDRGARSFRGGCPCWPCVARRIRRVLHDALFGSRTAVT